MAPKTALLLACGSFNPPTHMHLRLFELAKDHLQQSGIQVLGGIISPVNDAYQKKSLIPSKHRIQMVELALRNYEFVRCSQWESEQRQWIRTRAVLDQYSLQVAQGMKNGEQLPSWLPDFPIGNGEIPKLLLLCGGDLLETFSEPGLWQDEDILTIAKDYGLVVISREGSNAEKYVYDHDILHKYRENIHFVTERIPNDISSSRVRKAIKRGESIRFLVPDAVIEYIEANNVYQDDTNEDSNEYNNTSACLLIDMTDEPVCVEAVQSQEEPAAQDPPNCMTTAKDDTKCMTSPAEKIDPNVEPIIPQESVEIISVAAADTSNNLLVESNAETCLLINDDDDDDDEDCSCTTTGSRSPTPVHFEITPKGVKVISEKESFL